MADFEQELFRIGIPVKTRHNEVAPGQFEVAPTFETSNVACDHQMVIMEAIKRVAPRFGLQATLHEKPFAELNGSGKHNNWSMSTDTGVNLLDPQDETHTNMQFLLFLCAVIRAVDLHADLLRAAIASAGNDHRLGANEAPPAILSIFLGDMLTDLIEQLEKGAPTRTLRGGDIDLGALTLPAIPRDSGDRNRTSPFAFTGNKFEFRAVGASATSAWPNTVMNTIVAESLDVIATELEAKIDPTASKEAIETVVREVLQQVIRDHKRVIFNGDGYSDEWHKEAESRGLPNLKDSVQSIPRLESEEALALFENYNVLKPYEVKSRVNAALEKYAKQLLIESESMVLIANQMILPAALKQQTLMADAIRSATDAGVQCDDQREALRDFVDLVYRFNVSLSALAAADNYESEDPLELASYMKTSIAPLMDKLREFGDELETRVSREFWPMPSYRDLLFIK